ncbi:hypothetical protein [Streptomyces sp. NPDC089799]|uniref:hypothetical protein n=1 Tax=Streptomyces sp. NPDC089799 TaxID=3155066 RepID=UPI0034499896
MRQLLGVRRPARPASPPALLRAFSGLRPALIGLFALAGSLAVAWIAVRRSKPPAPQPGDHAWFHSTATEVAAQQKTSVGVLLVLAAVAFYLLLPLLVLAARLLRRRAGRLARPVFAVAAGLAAAAVSIPVVALSIGFAPDGAPVWPAVAADSVTVLRACVPAALLLAVCAGVPWEARGSDRPSVTRKPGPC